MNKNKILMLLTAASTFVSVVPARAITTVHCDARKKKTSHKLALGIDKSLTVQAKQPIDSPFRWFSADDLEYELKTSANAAPAKTFHIKSTGKAKRYVFHYRRTWDPDARAVAKCVVNVTDKPN